MKKRLAILEQKNERNAEPDALAVAPQADLQTPPAPRALATGIDANHMPSEQGALAIAFDNFTRASTSLETAYAALQERVEVLTGHLRDTQERLEASLDENLRLHEIASRTSRLEAMGRMAAEIAHEIRNPLGSLELTASMLRDDLTNDPARRELALSILEGIRALTSVTGNLLTFTRSVNPRREWLPVDQVLQKTADLVGAACAARGVLLRIESSMETTSRVSPTSRSKASSSRGDDEDLLLFADREQLQQVLLNLIQNALEATPAGGEVCLSAARVMLPRTTFEEEHEDDRWAHEEDRRDRGEDAVEIRVSDTGRGIDAHTLARAFDPFFTTKEHGTGLGLSISHRLAEAQGASLELAARPGKGTTATLRFRPWTEPPGGPALAGVAARPSRSSQVTDRVTPPCGALPGKGRQARGEGSLMACHEPPHIESGTPSEHREAEKSPHVPHAFSESRLERDKGPAEAPRAPRTTAKHEESLS